MGLRGFRGWGVELLLRHHLVPAPHLRPPFRVEREREREREGEREKERGREGERERERERFCRRPTTFHALATREP